MKNILIECKYIYGLKKILTAAANKEGKNNLIILEWR